LNSIFKTKRKLPNSKNIFTLEQKLVENISGLTAIVLDMQLTH